MNWKDLEVDTLGEVIENLYMVIERVERAETSFENLNHKKLKITAYRVGDNLIRIDIKEVKK